MADSRIPDISVNKRAKILCAASRLGSDAVLEGAHWKSGILSDPAVGLLARRDFAEQDARQPSEAGSFTSELLPQRPGIISRRKPLRYSVSGIVGRIG